jgi:hypothetical protein
VLAIADAEFERGREQGRRLTLEAVAAEVADMPPAGIAPAHAV